MNHLIRYLIILAALLAFGCATLALQEPDTATGFGVDNAGGVDAGTGTEGGK